MRSLSALALVALLSGCSSAGEGSDVDGPHEGGATLDLMPRQEEETPKEPPLLEAWLNGTYDLQLGFYRYAVGWGTILDNNCVYVRGAKIVEATGNATWSTQSGFTDELKVEIYDHQDLGAMTGRSPLAFSFDQRATPRAEVDLGIVLPDGATGVAVNQAIRLELHVRAHSLTVPTADVGPCPFG